MARDKELWKTIRAEFLATGLKYPELAKKYGVSVSTLKKVAAREGWTSDKCSTDKKALTGGTGKRNRKGTGTEEKEPEPTGAELVPTDSEILDIKRDRLNRFMEITDAMMDRISEALVSPDVVSPYGLKMLASALRDLREMQGLNKSALDIEEQQARIAKLRSETNTVDEQDGGGIIFMPTMVDRPTPPEEVAEQ